MYIWDGMGWEFGHWRFFALIDLLEWELSQGGERVGGSEDMGI